MVNLRKTLLTASEALKVAGVPHALIGGFALATYGFHRATIDVDFLADGNSRDLVKQVLIENGFFLVCETDEVLQFSGLGQLDVLLANRPLTQEMLRRARVSSALGIYVVRAEDLIALKIQAYINDPSRELQDKADIQKLLVDDQLDFELIKKYADLFGEWPAIESLRKRSQ